MNAILDWAQRRGSWVPCTAGVLSGLGISIVITGSGDGWLFLGAGVMLTAIRPAGISLRRRVLLTQVRRQIADYERQVR